MRPKITESPWLDRTTAVTVDMGPALLNRRWTISTGAVVVAIGPGSSSPATWYPTVAGIPAIGNTSNIVPTRRSTVAVLTLKTGITATPSQTTGSPITPKLGDVRNEPSESPSVLPVPSVGLKATWNTLILNLRVMVEPNTPTTDTYLGPSQATVVMRPSPMEMSPE